MLSYQHLYHAGNLADVHKHVTLSWILNYMIRKDKPLSYIETHGGRGLYDLSADEAVKTGEAAVGINSAELWFAADHPYSRALNECRTENGVTSYPGSPWIASHLLRGDDVLHIAELHPQEFEELYEAVPGAHVHAQDGFEMAYSMCPPTPRRGLMLIDPSYELKDDYVNVPYHLAKIAKIWPVGVLMLWYPILTDARHRTMKSAILRSLPDALNHEVYFKPAREGHRMVGSGLVVVNAPWGLDGELADLGNHFTQL